MSLAIDGVWKAGVWATTVWADGVWFEGAVVVVIDPSVGTEERKRRDRSYRKRRKRLREQLEAAFNSEYGIVAEQALAEFIEPQKTDAVARPVIERFDFEGAWRRYEEVVARLERLARLAEEDDEESTLLFS